MVNPHNAGSVYHQAELLLICNSQDWVRQSSVSLPPQSCPSETRIKRPRLAIAYVVTHFHHVPTIFGQLDGLHSSHSVDAIRM